MTSSLLKQVERLRYLAILLLSLCAFANASAYEAATSDEINEKMLWKSAIKPTWTNDADNPWYLYEYGGDYDADGNYIANYRLRTPSLSSGTSSTMSMTYSSEYETALYFEGEASYYEDSNINVLVDGEEKTLITDDERTRVFIRIPAGEHTVEFVCGYGSSYVYNLYIGEAGALASQCVKQGCSTPFTITNDSTFPWITRDGFIQSTNFTDEGSTSKVSASFEIDKTSVVSFECRNLSYGCSTNIYVDGKLWGAYNKISNEDNPWQPFSIILDSGSHTLEFENEITGETTPSLTTWIRNISIEESSWTEVAVTSPGQFVANLVEAIGDLSVLDVKYLKITGSLNERDWEGISRLSGLVAVDLRGLDTKSLPDHAFYGKADLSSVLLPETLEEIGLGAFSGTSLSSISLPESLRIIHSSAFYSSDLAEIHIPSNVESIEYEAFSYCRDLTKIIFADDSKLSFIGGNAFGYTGITEFLMPDAVEKIEARGYSPFYGCNALRYVKVSKSLKSINNDLFEYNSNIESVEIPEGITSIGSYAFSGTNIESITLPESLISIGSHAFGGSSLKSIKIPQNVTYIGESAFNNCINLTEVTLNSYSNDLSSTFYGCESIKTITVPSVTPPAVTGDPFGSVDKDNVTVLVPEFSLVSYKVDPYWFLFRHIKASAEISTSDFWAIHGHLRLNSSSILNGTPSIEIEAGGILDVAENTPLTLNEVSYNTQEAVPAVFLNESDQVTATSLTTKFSVPSSGTWYFFSPVTDVNMADVTYPATDSWVIRYYDGANRAATDNASGNWVNMPSNGTLKRGQGYIIQAAAAGTLYMPAATTQHSAFFGLDEAPMTLADNTCESAENAGWNFVGNPYPTFYDIYSMELSAPITVWTGSTYRAYSLEDDDFVLRPMQPFFVQKTAADITLGMPRGGRIGTSVITRAAAPRFNAIDANRHKLNLEITSGDNETADDYTRIVLNESASLSYEGKCDASKFMSMNTEVAQIYSLGDNRHPLAINERPYADGNAQLGIYIPKGGETYRISAVRADRKVWLYDAVSGTEQDLTEADYIFTADKAGNDDSRFSIRFAPATGTSVEGVDATAVKVIGGKGVISVSAPIDAEVAVYAADGSVIANAKGDLEAAVAAGVYVVTVNGQSFKTIVK
ncbi:MAG: leucine-rich repeat protein [Muribaculaceae bacterium]|nr:leucine-rich repeat protein [Muribaculaceae bacterium]